MQVSTESSLAVVFTTLCVKDLRSSRLLAPHFGEFGRFSAVALPYSKDGPLTSLDRSFFLRPDQIQIAPGQGYQYGRKLAQVSRHIVRETGDAGRYTVTTA